MSEIEKMYENANAYKNLCKCSFKNLFDYSIDYGQDVCIHVEDEIRHGCEGCELAEQNIKYYPPFTAEKQIAILQLLTQRCDLTISHFTEWKFIHFDGQEPTQVTGKDFTKTFAKLINAYWQDLTEEDKTSIKNILEM